MQGHLPADVIQSFRAFLEFYYIARRDLITEDDLDALQDAISRFHSFREVFAPIWGTKGFSLPRQHAMVHYPSLIRLFGAPNGVCSSITESKHIRVVKEPWRRSSRNDALFQMLTTNQRLDQLSAARVQFTKRAMLHGTLLEGVAVANGIVPHRLLLYVWFLKMSQDENNNECAAELEQPGNADASIADEDEGGQDIIVNDDSILAEVKFSQRCRESAG